MKKEWILGKHPQRSCHLTCTHAYYMLCNVCVA